MCIRIIFNNGGCLLMLITLLGEWQFPPLCLYNNLIHTCVLEGQMSAFTLLSSKINLLKLKSLSTKIYMKKIES